MSTPFAAERSCLGNDAFPPVPAASALSTDVRHRARFPSLHKETARG